MKGHPGRIIKQGDIVFKAVQQNEQDIAALKRQLDPETSNVAKERVRQVRAKLLFSSFAWESSSDDSLEMMRRAIMEQLPPTISHFTTRAATSEQQM